MNAPEQRRSLWLSRSKLLLIALLFAIPPVAAWALLRAGWYPEVTVNHGALVQPPEPVAQAGLSRAGGDVWGADDYAGRWTLLVVAADGCDATCAGTLDLVRRARIALNQHMERVQLALVRPEAGAPLPIAVPGLQDLQAPAEVLARWRGPEQAGMVSVQLVDPWGYRMMAYAAPLDGKGLLADLRRLLRASNEDIERLQRSGELAHE